MPPPATSPTLVIIESIRRSSAESSRLVGRSGSAFSAT
jgi:hypothetical protein